MKLEIYLDELEKKLIRSFDIFRNHQVNNEEYDLFARYHLRAEKYFLTKSAKIYAMENNEYILAKKMENLDKGELKRFTDNLVSSIDELVELHDEHMSSIITGVILVDKPIDQIDGNILDSIRKFKYHKGFSFGFKGWVDIRIILTSLDDGSNIANRKGREVSEIYGFTG